MYVLLHFLSNLFQIFSKCSLYYIKNVMYEFKKSKFYEKSLKKVLLFQKNGIFLNFFLILHNVF